MKTRAIRFMVMLLWVGLGATGCTYLQDLVGLGVQQPKVHLVEFNVTKVSLTALELIVSLRVDNPNNFDINFDKLRYKLSASGAQIASGTLQQHITVPGGGQAVVHLPLTVNGTNVLSLLHELLTKSSETYALLAAAADFDTPFGAMEVRIDAKKPLRKLLGF